MLRKLDELFKWRVDFFHKVGKGGKRVEVFENKKFFRNFRRKMKTLIFSESHFFMVRTSKKVRKKWLFKNQNFRVFEDDHSENSKKNKKQNFYHYDKTIQSEEAFLISKFYFLRKTLFLKVIHNEALVSNFSSLRFGKIFFEDCRIYSEVMSWVSLIIIIDFIFL